MIQTKTTHCFFCAILLLGLVSNCSPTPPTDALTVQYGPELQTAYENYKQALVIAYETGDTTDLEQTTTSDTLKLTREQITQLEDPKGMAEGAKVEVIRLRVIEYYTDTAKVSLSERFIGDLAEDTPSILPNICKFQREDNIWKVSVCYRPRDNW